MRARYRCHLSLLLAIGCVATVSQIASAVQSSSLDGFATGGHIIYQLQCGQIQPRGDTVIVAAATDGTVLCFSKSGKLIWKNQDNHALPLDLEVNDIDGDGYAETLVASADGTLYVWDHEGTVKWRFQRVAPLIQGCVVKGDHQPTVVLTGGIDKTLFALSPEGNVVNSLASPYVVRHIRCGNFLGDGKQYAAVVTAKNDHSRFFLQLYDTAGLKPLWKKPVGLATDNPTKGTKFEVPWLAYRVAVLSALPIDVNQDGRDEIVLTDHFERCGIFYAYDYRGQKVLTSSSKGIRRRPYRMNLLTRVTLPGKQGERIVGLFGKRIIVYRLDGSIEQTVTGPYSLACAAYDVQSATLFLGSSVSGGDGIYALRLDRPGWKPAFKKMRPVGRLAEVEANLKTLANQVQRFHRPPYQRAPKAMSIITGKSRDEIKAQFLDAYPYRNTNFVQFNLFTEDYDRATLAAPWNKKRETRHKYNYSADQIIAFAAERERRKEPFALWAGHGNDPFYMQLSTIKGILEAAPTMAKALVFPEMERTDDAMRYAVQSHIIPIAELCRKQGTAKIVLRNKNIFWNASCYLDLWRETLLSGEYRDVFVPSMEETNGRTQAISLSGRMGLWLTGHFDQLSARAVTDNANFSRFWEWSAQQNLSHLMRSLTLHAALGAEMFLVNIHQGDPRDLAVFYRMLDAGVITVPERAELLSVSDVCLGMRAPDPEFLRHGKNGHNINQYEPTKTPMVFDRMDCYWGGAPTTEEDFSRYAMGSRNRMLNFLPTNPFGLVASVPEGTSLDDSPRFRSMLVTDGKSFFDNEKTVSASDHKPHALRMLEDAARRLPVRVDGDVAWTVARLDPTHVRVTLIDSGYISPADRQVVIHLQHLQGTACQDILSGKLLPIADQSISLTVPAGILRVIDITHSVARHSVP